MIGGPVDPPAGDDGATEGEGENLLTVEDNQLDISRDSLDDEDASLRSQPPADVVSASTPSDDQMSPSTPFSSLLAVYASSSQTLSHDPSQRTIKPYRLPTPVGVSSKCALP